ncbi:hypothetical protein PQX77_016812 [Marasmius sp. AFHP31]|nr:hypothetical protein PQX77_016812 [Marasmius sp. AFHP31]
MASTGKTLSTGTLSLRFMQNARNRQQEVQLEKAHVEDDGQWEISKEVRDSWGVNAQQNQLISHETSYLPFLFPSTVSGHETSAAASNTISSTPDDSPTVYKRRRVFNKGKEVEGQVFEAVAESSTAGSEVHPTPDEPVTQSGKGKRIAARTSMLSKSKPVESNGNLKPGRPISKSLPTAKLAIFDSSGVGTDLHSSSQLLSGATLEESASSKPAKFMKPVGVDDPKLSGRSSTMESSHERKRLSPTEQDGPKRKKKKKSHV